MVKDLTQCIRLNLDCADICAATGAMTSRRTGSNVDVLRAAMQACAEASLQVSARLRGAFNNGGRVDAVSVGAFRGTANYPPSN